MTLKLPSFTGRSSAVLSLLALTASIAWADGLSSLQDFIQNTRSGRADFTQTVTAPPRDGKPGRVKTSSGTFEFQRPGKFRFDYKKPFVQWVKAVPKTKDGQLQQVQVGFDGDKLAALEILDSFGQRSVLKFGAMQLNPQLPAGAFEFKPPAGADVLKQ